MTYKSVSIKEARDSFSEIIERAALAGEYFVITKFGKKKAVIAPFEGEMNMAGVGVKKANVLKSTAGAWKSRKDIGRAREWAGSLRKSVSARHEKVFG